MSKFDRNKIFKQTDYNEYRMADEIFRLAAKIHPLRAQDYAVKGASSRRKGKLKWEGCAGLKKYVMEKLELR